MYSYTITEIRHGRDWLHRVVVYTELGVGHIECLTPHLAEAHHRGFAGMQRMAAVADYYASLDAA